MKLSSLVIRGKRQTFRCINFPLRKEEEKESLNFNLWSREVVKCPSVLPGKDCVCSWKFNNLTKGIFPKREGCRVPATSKLWNLLLKVQWRQSKTGRSNIIQLTPASCFHKFSGFMNLEKWKEAVSEQMGFSRVRLLVHLESQMGFILLWKWIVSAFPRYSVSRNDMA